MPASATPTDPKATSAGLLAIVLWSSLALLTTLTGNLPPFLVLATSFACAGVLGLVRVAGQGRAGWRSLLAPWPALLLSTAGLFGYHALYFYALKHAPAVEANLINYLWPLLIVLLSGLLPGVQLRAGNIIGSLFGLLAAVLLVTGGRGIQIDATASSGYAAAFGAALIWGLYSVLNRRHADVPSSSIVLPCVGVACLGLLAHLAFEPAAAPTAGQWGVMLVMGAGPVGAAFWLWDTGTKRGDISLLGSLSYLAPLLSTLLLVVAGRATPHWSHAVAVGLLLAGGWISLHASRTVLRS